MNVHQTSHRIHFLIQFYDFTSQSIELILLYYLFEICV